MADADAAGINLMPDAAFNHGAWDIELGQAGVDYIMSAVGASGWSASDLIHDREVRVFSRKNDYAQRASYYVNFFNNDIAPAPDRGDFGKWLDVVDIFFGRYAALVNQNPSDNDNRTSEADWFNYNTVTGNFDGITQGVWRYFAHYAPYWLGKGRAPGTNRNSTPADGDAAARYAWDARGIDGLRCDFGQGLPPQAWEYNINVARSYKWSFVFMSESLDGGAITYRSNRHFDILNESIAFPGKSASTADDYRYMFYLRRASYGQGLVLLNTVSHDEDNYQDPWQAFIRYAVYGTIDGAPMIFPGQELGISNLYGYDLYEINFNKPVPHFKTYNSMMIAWGNTDYALDQLNHAYSAINAARGFSKALRSSNRHYLDRKAGGVDQSIFSIGKFETLNGSPANKDVVFGFVNLNRNGGQSNTFDVSIDSDSNGVNDFGIKTARKYNVKNIAAHLGQSAGRRDTFLWGAGLNGGNILSNGIYIGMNAIPGSSSGAWAAAPYEALYLKLYDTTAPGAVSGSLTNNLANGSYAITNQATFTWAAVAADSEGIVPSYQVNISTNGVLATNAIVTSNSYTYTAPNADTKVEVTVQAVNPNDTSSASAATGINTSYLLTSGGDYNNNGTNNATDISNGSNPTVNSTPAAVYINEVQSTNTGLPDQHGQLLDWVELYNPGGSSFDLSGYYLSDSLSNKLKYQFPNGTTIPAGSYLLVWCGNATDGPVTSPYNVGQIRTTAFAISSGGEPIVLTAPDGTTIVDQFVSLAIGTSGTPAVGRSLGRGTGASFDTLYFYTSPTRATANSTSGTEAIPLTAPVFSVDGGIFTNNQSVAISTTESNAVIRYTLDGSDPTESSPVYSNTLTLTSAGNTNTTNSYIPSNDILSSDYPYYDAWTAPNGSVARINVLRARVFRTGKAPSRITTKSYLINAQGTNRYAFPVVSIATTPANLFSDATGIYVRGTNTY
ncbi:MAG: lamin tail domain-containing protein, partial [Chthoniobacterales bacterium]